MPTRLPEMANAMEYIEMDNEARANVGLPSNYPADAIERIVKGTDPNYYNNTDWIDAVYKKWAPQQNYTVSLTGKSPLMGYYLSFGYLDQEGLTVGSTTDAIRHNIRTKINTRIANLLDITANIGYTTRKYAMPSGGFDSDNGALYSAMRISPVIPAYFTDGGWGYGGGSANPVALLYASGQNKFNSQEISGNFTGKLDITKSWNVSGTYTLLKSNSLREILSKTINYYRPGTTEIWYTTNPTNKYENRDYTSLKQTIIAQTNFEKTFNKHYISAIAGFSQEWYLENNFTAERTRLTTEIDPSIEFGDLTAMSNSASANDWAIRSGFGRINYIFADRYLLESNIRYDLSSRFPKKHRGGLFPSFSAGWRLSEEPFMEGIRNFADNIKIRASWGILGNQYVGASNYPYLAYLTDVAVPTIGTVANLGYTQAILPNDKLTWETIHMTDVGFDASFLQNRLSLTADWFIKDTKDILLVLTYPNVLGMTPTDENAGAVRNKGWEVEVKWDDKIGDGFSYGVSMSLSDVKNEVTDLAGLAPTVGSYDIRKVGEPIGAFYGLVDDGIAMPWDFQRYDATTQKYIGPKFPILSSDAGLVQPGDIKYKDLGGPNGVPDGKITLDNDREVIGSPIPRYTYDFKGNIAWKGIDFNFMLQGVGKADGYLTGAGRHAFIDQSAYPQKIHKDRWTPSNPDPNAPYPRFTANYNYNQRFSTFWLEDASYLRVKNIQLGYTFKKSFTEKMKIDKCRIYVSADNLFTVTDFFYAYDPESPVSSGGFYPQVKTVVMGFNVTFK
jgi:TonB-linked SusC/RagA family outer membrane protein